MPDAPERDRPDGGTGTTPARRRRRAVGPAGAAPSAPDAVSGAWAVEAEVLEDDDERLLREVPPHHGG